MADDISVIPITDEQAKLGQEIVGALRGVGSFFKEALGSMPQDIIGYLGGDWLRIRRAENIAEMLNKTKKRLESWGDLWETFGRPLGTPFTYSNLRKSDVPTCTWTLPGR